MKTLKQIVRSTLVALTLSVALSGCLKKSDEPQPQLRISGLCLIHASPTTEKIDVYLNQTKVSGIDFAYKDKIDYLNAYSGDRQISMSKKGLSASLKMQNIHLKPQTGYSLFLIDKLNTISFLLLTDTLTKPIVGKAKIRFVNLSPDAGALNLAIEGVAGDLVTDKLFKEYSAFKSINPAERVMFIVKNKTSGLTETVLHNVKIEADKVYTFWVKGLKNDTNDFSLGASIYQHK